MGTPSTDIPQTLGRRIAARSDGLHAIPWSARQRPDGVIPGQMMSLWRTVDDFQILPLDWPFAFGSGCAETAFVGNRIIVSDCPGGVGPALVREYDANSLAMLQEWTYGDIGTRPGCSCQTSAGGMVIVNFVTLGPNAPQYGFDIAYKAPAPPALNAAPAWAYKRILLPATEPSVPISLMDCVEVGGVVYVFHGFDSSGRWDLLTINLSDLSTKHTVGFIGRGSGDVAPSIEIPTMTTCLDKAGNRILLAYQNVHQFFTGCPGGSPMMAYPTSIVEVPLEDMVPRLIMVLPWDTFHTPCPPTPMWPRPDGIYIASQKRTNCDVSTAMYRIESGQAVQITADVPGGAVQAFSCDGWVIYTDPSEALPYVTTRPPMAPQMGIKPWMNTGGKTESVMVSWDCSNPTDKLETTQDLQTWIAVREGASPIEVPVSQEREFFRVRR